MEKTNITIDAKPFLLHVSYKKEFAILNRTPNEEGLQGITFSIPLGSKDADIIDQSGIAEVISYNVSGIMTFKRKPFYTNSTMIELIVDILLKNERNRAPIAERYLA